MWLSIGLVVLAVPGVLFAYSLHHAARMTRQYPPVGAVIRLSNGALHYLDRGHGRPVVLVHGASANLRDWTATIFDEVARRHRAIAFDRPGHGWSEGRSAHADDPRVQARVLHELIERLGLEQPVLVGHSWGGSVVLAYALAHPENTGGLVLLSPVSHPWPRTIGWQCRLAAVPLIGPLYAWTLAAAGFRLLAADAVREVFRPNEAPGDYIARSGLGMCARPGSFMANARELVNTKAALEEMAGRYGEIRAPTVIITGQDDSVLATEVHTRPLTLTLANSRLVSPVDIGHMPHHAAPKAVLAAIDSLVAGHNEIGIWRRDVPRA